MGQDSTPTPEKDNIAHKSGFEIDIVPQSTTEALLNQKVILVNPACEMAGSQRNTSSWTGRGKNIRDIQPLVVLPKVRDSWCLGRGQLPRNSLKDPAWMEGRASSHDADLVCDRVRNSVSDGGGAELELSATEEVQVLDLATQMHSSYNAEKSSS